MRYTARTRTRSSEQQQRPASRGQALLSSPSPHLTPRCRLAAAGAARWHRPRGLRVAAPPPAPCPRRCRVPRGWSAQPRTHAGSESDRRKAGVPPRPKRPGGPRPRCARPTNPPSWCRGRERARAGALVGRGRARTPAEPRPACPLAAGAPLGKLPRLRHRSLPGGARALSSLRCRPARRRERESQTAHAPTARPQRRLAWCIERSETAPGGGYTWEVWRGKTGVGPSHNKRKRVGLRGGAQQIGGDGARARVYRAINRKGKAEA